MRNATLILLLLLLCSCKASMPRYMPPNGAPAQLSLRVQGDFDSVWQAIVSTFAESTTGIETIEKASGFVAAARPIDFAGVKNLPELVDLGVIDGIWASSRIQARPENASARVRYNVLVVQAQGEQEVRVNTTWTGSAQILGHNAGGGPMFFALTLTGNSTGLFERALLEKIAARVPGRAQEIVETQPFRRSTFQPEPRNYGQATDADGWIREGTAL